VSQNEPAERTTGGGAPEKALRPGLARRLAALWSQPFYRFAAVYVALLAGGVMIYPALRVRFSGFFDAGEAFTAEAVYRVMSRFTAEVELAAHNTVFFGPSPVKITDECSGIYEALLLGAALIAFPTAWYKTAIGFAVGFPLIYALNIVRIVALLVAERSFGCYFEFLHLTFWPVTMIAMVASTFLVWVLWAVRSDSLSHAA
jgi:exosortase/archaeosortase family protein